MVVQRKRMLKYQKQMKKCEEVTHKKDLLELKKNENNKQSVPQLKDMFKKKVPKMDHCQQ